MYAKVLICALAAAPLVAAHAKLSVVTGNNGGNGTAFGVQGAVIPGTGQNYQTEPDSTVFWSKEITTNQDLGYTDAAGDNQLSDLATTMELSGSTLPQVSAGGSASGTWHIVTSDGAGPFEALIDESASGAWSTALNASVLTQVPGVDGWISASGTKRDLSRMFGKRQTAVNVNKDYPFSVAIPAGAACNGTINGQSNLCLVKLSNNNENGPFGGVFAVQMST